MLRRCGAANTGRRRVSTRRTPAKKPAAAKIGCPSVPSMGRISLDERSQPEPMTATVAKRKA
jgi:hypothetical protein